MLGVKMCPLLMEDALRRKRPRHRQRDGLRHRFRQLALLGCPNRLPKILRLSRWLSRPTPWTPPITAELISRRPKPAEKLVLKNRIRLMFSKIYVFRSFIAVLFFRFPLFPI